MKAASDVMDSDQIVKKKASKKKSKKVNSAFDDEDLFLDACIT